MLTHNNFIAEEIKSRLNSGDACCHSVKNCLSSSLLSKNVKIKIYRTVISPVLWVYECETWSWLCCKFSGIWCHADCKIVTFARPCCLYLLCLNSPRRVAAQFTWLHKTGNVNLGSEPMRVVLLCGGQGHRWQRQEAFLPIDMMTYPRKFVSSGYEQF